MKAISLKKLLTNRKLSPILESLKNISPQPFSIRDDKGQIVYGETSSRFDAEIPLYHKETQVGTIRGSENIQYLASMLSNLLESEIEKKSLASETLDNYKELTSLYDVASEFSLGMSLEEVGRIFVKNIRKNIREDTVSIMLYNDKADTLELLYSEGKGADADFSLRPGEGIAGHVFLSGKSEIVNNIVQDKRYIDGPVKLSSLISTPLTSGKKNLGVINIGTVEPYEYSARDLNLMFTLASQAASTIENTILYENLLKSEAEYRSLYENAVEGIFRCSYDNRILSVNPSMARILGFSSPQELVDTIQDFTIESFVEPEKWTN